MAELCARLEVDQPDAPGGKCVIYVKSRWFATRFVLSISDGLDAWTCNASEEEVSRKAFSWDVSVVDYLEDAQGYLDWQKPNSTYSFIHLGEGTKKFSWTRERNGVQLVAHWKVEKSGNPKEITCDILDCLMRGTTRLSEELQRKNISFERMKAEAERAEAQSQKFTDQKIQFETDIYKKFVAVLNSKKAKLRQLRELGLQQHPADPQVRQGEMGDETESEDELDESEEEDNHSEDKKSPDEQAADVDSKSFSLHQDLPAGNNSGMDCDPSHSIVGDTKGDIADQEPKFPTETGVSKRVVQTFTEASTLLGGSTYTSAPRKRRNL